jgi:hypothetical protein
LRRLLSKARGPIARGDERGDAAFIACFGLAVFFLLLGGTVIDLWGLMGAEHNLQAVAQAAAEAGASGVDTGTYRSTGQVVLLGGNSEPPCPVQGPCEAYTLAITDLEEQEDLPAAVSQTTCGPNLTSDPDCNLITVNGASITVVLHEDVSSLVLRAAGRRSLPITVSATSVATISADGL